MFGEKNTVFQHKNLIPPVKHGCDSITFWAGFTACGPGLLAIKDSKHESRTQVEPEINTRTAETMWGRMCMKTKTGCD